MGALCFFIFSRQSGAAREVAAGEDPRGCPKHRRLPVGALAIRCSVEDDESCGWIGRMPGGEAVQQGKSVVDIAGEPGAIGAEKF
jgi:hypothetical protein